MYITYVNLPKIPQELLDDITDEFILSQTNNAFPQSDQQYKIIKHEKKSYSCYQHCKYTILL